MRFIVDAQLPPALAGWLNSEGQHATHVIDLGLIAAADSAIWDYAGSNNFTIITKDEDFAIRAMRESIGPAIVWVRIGNCGNDQLRKWIMPLFPLVFSALVSGERLIELA